MGEKGRVLRSGEYLYAQFTDSSSSPVVSCDVPPQQCRDPRYGPVNKTERKVRQEIPTRIVYITRPTIRGFSHSFYAGVDFRRKSLGGDGAPLSVPLHSGFNLGCRCRMKSNPSVRHPYAS